MRGALATSLHTPQKSAETVYSSLFGLNLNEYIRPSPVQMRKGNLPVAGLCAIVTEWWFGGHHFFEELGCRSILPSQGCSFNS